MTSKLRVQFLELSVVIIPIRLLFVLSVVVLCGYVSFDTRLPLDNRQIYQVLHVFLDLAIILIILGFAIVKETHLIVFLNAILCIYFGTDRKS